MGVEHGEHFPDFWLVQIGEIALYRQSEEGIKKEHI